MTEQQSARQRVHVLKCRDSRCIVAVEDPGKACGALDDLLDQVEAEAVQRVQGRLLHMHTGVLLTHGPDAAGGLGLAIAALAKAAPVIVSVEEVL